MSLDRITTVTFTDDHLLALKGALEIAESELRRRRPPSAPIEPERLARLVDRAAGWVTADAPVRAELTRGEAEVLAHYTNVALRLRGYVVGRPEANQRYVDLYRLLTATAQGRRGWRDRLRAMVLKRR